MALRRRRGSSMRELPRSRSIPAVRHGWPQVARVCGDVMRPSRRSLIQLVSGALALSAVPCVAWSEAYPPRSVRIVVSLPAGFAADIVARLVAQQVSAHLGQ